MGECKDGRRPRLTSKQKSFARMLHTGSSQLEAYRSSYDVSPTAKVNALRVAASTLFKKRLVQEELKRLDELDKNAEVISAVMSKTAKKSRFAEIAERVLREGVDKRGFLLPSAAATAIKAYETIARMDGDFADAENEAAETHLDRLRRALSASTKP